MRLACPNCDAKYEVPDDAIPEAGRDVQCSSCGHAWFQLPPDIEAAAEEEAALYGDDLPPPPSAPPSGPQADAAPAPAPDADLAAAFAAAGISDAPPAPQPQPSAPPEDDDPAEVPAAAALRAASAPAAQVLEDSVLAVLREEAERETEARRQEAQRAASRQADAEGQMQVQPDLGVAEPALAAAGGLSPTQRRLAMLKGEDPDAPPPPPARPAARRDLLPDVEEINSTLQPSDGGDDEEPDVDALPDLTKGRSGFRTGFLLMIFVLAVATVVYLAAPSIATSVPALEGAMTAYVAFVDGLRLWLNDLMSSASDRLNPGDAG